MASEAGLSHLIVKIAAGSEPVAIETGLGTLVGICQKVGLEVWGWHDVYGDDAIGEAQIAVRQSNALGLSGLVIRADAAYEYLHKHSSAERFIHDVRLALDIPLALSSYRFPYYHPRFPWASFLKKVDFYLAQVFWEAGRDAVWQLHESYRQCTALPYARPYLVTGPAYRSPNGWAPREQEIRELMESAFVLGVEAVNFYEWNACHKSLPLVWKAIVECPWPQRR